MHTPAHHTTHRTPEAEPTLKGVLEKLTGHLKTTGGWTEVHVTALHEKEIEALTLLGFEVTPTTQGLTVSLNTREQSPLLLLAHDQDHITPFWEVDELLRVMQVRCTHKPLDTRAVLVLLQLKMQEMQGHTDLTLRHLSARTVRELRDLKVHVQSGPGGVWQVALSNTHHKALLQGVPQKPPLDLLGDLKAPGRVREAHRVLKEMQLDEALKKAAPCIQHLRRVLEKTQTPARMKPMALVPQKLLDELMGLNLPRGMLKRALQHHGMKLHYNLKTHQAQITPTREAWQAQRHPENLKP